MQFSMDCLTLYYNQVLAFTKKTACSTLSTQCAKRRPSFFVKASTCNIVMFDLDMANTVFIRFVKHMLNE